MKAPSVSDYDVVHVDVEDRRQDDHDLFMISLP